MILYFPDITTNLSDYRHLLVWYRVTHSFNLPIFKRTNVCLFNGKLHPFGTSVEFYEKNSFLFENITNQINRDNQLTKILN
jgi:hypothetical protein